MGAGDGLAEALRIYRRGGLPLLFRRGEKSLAWRTRYLYYRYLRTRLGSRCDFDTAKIEKVRIDPVQVRHTAGINTPIREVFPVDGADAVVGTLAGFWDRFKRPIEEVSAYRRLQAIHERGGTDDLLASMANGYREQHELPEATKTESIRNRELPDEPRLAVGRNDEFMRWTGGYNRIAAAQLLGVEEITAYVVVWHPQADRERLTSAYAVERD